MYDLQIFSCMKGNCFNINFIDIILLNILIYTCNHLFKQFQYIPLYKIWIYIIKVSVLMWLSFFAHPNVKTSYSKWSQTEQNMFVQTLAVGFKLLNDW